MANDPSFDSKPARPDLLAGLLDRAGVVSILALGETFEDAYTGEPYADDRLDAVVTRDKVVHFELELFPLATTYRKTLRSFTGFTPRLLLLTEIRQGYRFLYDLGRSRLCDAASTSPLEINACAALEHAPDTLLIEALTYDPVTYQLFVHTAA